MSDSARDQPVIVTNAFTRRSPIMRRARHLLVVVAAVSLCCTSCSNQQTPPQSVADAQTAFDQAVQAFEGGQYAEALNGFNTALETPGLAPDLAASALLKRAVCLADSGNFDAALRDLHEAEQGPCPTDQVHVARGLVLRKQGQTAAAQAEFQQAKKLNPHVELPR